MEKRKFLYDNLLEELSQKVPKKSELVKIVTDTLKIEKESAYRRLRGEIPFTLNEAGIIAAKLGISLDTLLHNGSRTTPNTAYLALSLNNGKDSFDFGPLALLADKYREIASHGDSQHGMAVNTIPAALYLNRENLSRFMFFKSSHRYGDTGYYMHYSDIYLPEEAERIHNELVNSIHKMERTVCVMDTAIIANVVRDLEYYMQVHFITRQEAVAIMKDLSELIDELQYITQYGHFRDTGNKFEVYLSQINIGTGYTYASGGGTYASGIMAFVMQPAVSFGKEAYIRIRDWVDYVKRTSSLVSLAGAKERIEFLDSQRKLIDILSGQASV